jgi:hypothetical protein
LKVYKTQIFNKWSKKEGITDRCLCKAVNEIESGLIDAELGSGLVKKRMPKPGQGKSGSYRTLLAFRNNHRAFFLTGFSKNGRENITSDEKDVFKKLCAIYLNASVNELELMCKTRKLIEVGYE